MEVAASKTHKRKLSYKEQRELDQLPAEIKQLEDEQAALQKSLAEGNIFRDNPSEGARITVRIAAIEEELMTALERWSILTDS